MPEATQEKVAEAEQVKEAPVPDIKFPPIDKLGSHFYDNEAGTFWLGLKLDNDPTILSAVVDAAKLPMLNALGDFLLRQARKAELMGKPKQGGMIDRLRSLYKV